MDHFCKGAVVVANPLLRSLAFDWTYPLPEGGSRGKHQYQQAANRAEKLWLRTGSGFDSASESLAQTVAKEAEVWRRHDVAVPTLV